MMVYVALLPASIAALEGEAARVKSTPLPLSATACGLPSALSLIRMLPAAGPTAVGTKYTPILQLAPGLSVAGQLLTCVKLPVTVMEEIASGPGALAVSVTFFPALTVPTGWLEKLRLEGESVGALTAPVPERLTPGGGTSESLDNASIPVRGPLTEGVNVTLIEHAAPAPRLVPQLFVWAKSPFGLIPLIVNAASPVF